MTRTNSPSNISETMNGPNEKTSQELPDVASLAVNEEPSQPYKHRHHRSNKSAGVILIDPWSYNYNDPTTYRIMVVQQKGSGVWGLPKGHLEPGETLYQAALREMREETGVHLISAHESSPEDESKTYEGSLREHVDFVPVPLKMVPMAIQESEIDREESKVNVPADNTKTNPSQKEVTHMHRNHVQIKKIHFFVFVLRRSGQSLVPAPVDSHEIIRVSWLHVQSWNVDALEMLRKAGYSVPVPKFNRTLSDGSVSTLQEVARKVGVQMATYACSSDGQSKADVLQCTRSCDHLF
jgi:8-oxo-dGTP pyrophosphatase MutT (NUDIX family)